MGARVQVRVDDQATTDKGVHEQVQKTLQVASAAAHQLGHAGGRCVLGKTHRQLGHALYFGVQVDPVPGAGLGAGKPQHAVPAAHLERRAHADPHQPCAQRPQAVPQRIQVAPERGQQGFCIRKRVGQAFALAHHTRKVDQQAVRAAPADVDTDGKRAVRVQRQRHRWLADAPAYAFVANQQAVVLQPRGDQADGLRGQAGQARQIGLGQAAVLAYRLQHHALIELAHAHVVGAARAQQRWGLRGRGFGCGPPHLADVLEHRVPLTKPALRPAGLPAAVPRS